MGMWVRTRSVARERDFQVWLKSLTLKFLCTIIEIHFEPVIGSQSYLETFW